MGIGFECCLVCVSWDRVLEITSRLGRSLVVPTGSALSRDPVLLTDFKDGVEDFDLAALGEPSI